MTDQSFEALSHDYRSQGWCRVTLPDPAPLLWVRDALEVRLRELTGNSSATLATYHTFVADDEHPRIQWDLVNFFWDNDCCLRIAHGQINFFRNFIGPDLHIQKRPFLRIARPGRKEDNIGFHRDTLYGQSPYEVAVHVPLLDLDTESCLKFLPGSHVTPESAFPVVDLGDAEWGKGSPKHEMGFPYAPKAIDVDLTELVPWLLGFGGAVVFTPAMVHGQDINRGGATRFSFDFRVVNSFAPVKFRTDLSVRGYSILSESAVALVARRYIENCEATKCPGESRDANG
jgi:ectoine hydroxylase-related dioxygenase (phytanoyl-CoA dioxygenase family)